ncbi:MAG: polymerase, bacteriophage-type [Paucimonas sp.]|nr:polymerase, bacteriophage-type [Paucimonas sp.]
MTLPAKRLRMLEEMGIGPLWTLRAAHNQEAPAAGAVSGALPAALALPAVSDAAPAGVPDAGSAQVATSPVANVLDLPVDPGRAGIPRPAPVRAPESAWDTDSPSLPLPAMPVLAARLSPAPNVAALDWTGLEQAVAGCVACGLCQGRRNTVFGVGDRKARWLFVGEGPGRQEDLQGEPFIGPAGKLLDNMLKALGLSRADNAFIANVVKCRPSDATGRDRPPTEEEIATCLPYLARQVELVQPTVIVALGRIAATSLLGLPVDTAVGPLRGKQHRYRDWPVIVTYHPAYLLRQPTDKAKVWRDLCLARTLHVQS